mmetsp:Transcript_19620/g.34991  ORF Transcript_19620/g.34991 Transcript_19620/m.34991 type:complete len:1048 (-) Transcript_19620:322-3465(-)
MSFGLTLGTAILLAASDFGVEATDNMLLSPSRGNSRGNANSAILDGNLSKAKASRIFPFRERMGSHMQVGSGQEIQLKFTTKPDANLSPQPKFYIAIIAGVDQDKMHNESYTSWVQDYINSAPDSENEAQEHPRFHFCAHADGCPSGSGLNAASEAELGKCPIDQGAGKVERYKEPSDRYVYYHSEKYPFIIGAMQYALLPSVASSSSSSRGGDHFDFVCLRVPKVEGKGSHYIVHWFWGHNFDAVDVRTVGSEVPEGLVYGRRPGRHTFEKIDHCHFENPKQTFIGNLNRNVGVAGCEASLNQLPSSIESGITGVLGINEVASAAPRSRSSSSMKLSGIESVSKLDWSDWNREVQVIEGAKCGGKSNRVTATLAKAVAICASMLEECTGISVKSEDARFPDHYNPTRPPLHDANFPDHYNPTRPPLHDGEAKAEYLLCTGSSEPVEDSAYRLLQKKQAGDLIIDKVDPATWTSQNHASFKISFQPKLSSDQTQFSLPEDWLEDNGDRFGPVGLDLKYGWKCPMPMNLDPNNLDNFDFRTGRVSSEGWKRPCPDGKPNKWEIEVPSGVYAVTLYGGNEPTRGLGCVVENTLISADSQDEDQGTKAVEVEVDDGLFTLTSVQDSSMPSCSDVNWVKLDRVGAAYQHAWIPTAFHGAWWQLKLDEPSQEIGKVSIVLPGGSKPFRSDCRQRWFYEPAPSCHRGSRLHAGQNVHEPDLWQKFAQNQDVPHLSYERFGSHVWGEYDASNPNIGAVVSVSDSPCDVELGCSAQDETLCEVITKVPNCGGRSHKLCPIRVDCKGARGKYVRVRLRGVLRYLDVESVDVYRHHSSPAAANDDNSTPKCYALESREGSETTTEYTISKDPNDPVYASTCYVRTEEIEFLPSTGAGPEPKPKPTPGAAEQQVPGEADTSGNSSGGSSSDDDDTFDEADINKHANTFIVCAVVIFVGGIGIVAAAWWYCAKKHKNNRKKKKKGYRTSLLSSDKSSDIRHMNVAYRESIHRDLKQMAAQSRSTISNESSEVFPPPKAHRANSIVYVHRRNGKREGVEI